jgi:glycerophosphoryl diester phosphodiesterase
MQTPFDLQGHRGCRGLMPENTLAAMTKAIDLGVTTLEMDVVVTKDSVCLLSHEPFFSHEIATKPNGEPVLAAEEKGLNIFSMTFEETQLYDVGLRPHPRFALQQKMAATKPRLKDLLLAVVAYCHTNQRPVPFFNIETKSLAITDGIFHPGPETFVRLLMREIESAGLQEKVIIQSFDFRTLQVLHRTQPSIKTAALVEADDPLSFAQQLQKLGFVPAIYSPAFQLVTPLMVQQCKAIGIKLIPWTVNSPDEAKRLKAMGVDGLITDYPDRVR